MVTGSGDVKTLSGGSESDFQWFAESGVIGYGDPYKKRLKKVKMRVILPTGSRLAVFASYDDGEWEPCGEWIGTGCEPYDIYFIPQRCDRFRYSLSGEGECRIISIYRETGYAGE